MPQEGVCDMTDLEMDLVIANAEIKRLKALIPEWISVKERLPQEFVSVLVYMPEERPLPTVHEGYVTNQGKWYAHFFEREPFEVTHWMPLPEPPNEGGLE